MFLVDTNVISELPKRSPDPGVIRWLAGIGGLVISAVTVDELSYGVERAPVHHAVTLRRWLDELLETRPLVLPVDLPVALAAGVLRAQREKRGLASAQADMMIAATAMVSGRILVTRNTRHFDGCGVALLNPFSTP